MESNSHPNRDINYYKGVLLCSRPNQHQQSPNQKPFCSQVKSKQVLGLPPTKHYDAHHSAKRKLPVLSNHKKWLESFKKHLHQKKIDQELAKQREIRKLEKIKQNGRDHIQKLISLSTTQEAAPKEHNTQEQIQKVNLPQPLKQYQKAPLLAEQKAKIKQIQQERQTEQIKKFENKNREQEKGENIKISKRRQKNKKPAWSLTEEQAQANQEAQVDNLLNFFQQGEIKDYMSDENIKSMLHDLKDRIQLIKDKQNNQGNQKSHRKHIRERQNKDSNDERESKKSLVSKGESIASQKTAQRVEELERKKQQQQWDMISKSQKNTMATIDEQIAKNVADQVLRNYPALKHHSNQSIRQIMDRKVHS